MTGAHTPVDGLGRRPACVAGSATDQDRNCGPGAANLTGHRPASRRGRTRSKVCRTDHAFSRINLIAPDATARVDGRKDGTGSQGVA